MDKRELFEQIHDDRIGVKPGTTVAERMGDSYLLPIISGRWAWFQLGWNAHAEQLGVADQDPEKTVCPGCETLSSSTTVAHTWAGEEPVDHQLCDNCGTLFNRAELVLPEPPVKSTGSDVLQQYRDRAESMALLEAQELFPDNATAAAKYLGVSRPTFYRLLKSQAERDRAGS